MYSSMECEFSEHPLKAEKSLKYLKSEGVHSTLPNSFFKEKLSFAYHFV